MWIDIKPKKMLKWFLIIFEISLVLLSPICLFFDRVDLAIYCLMLAFYVGRGYE